MRGVAMDPGFRRGDGAGREATVLEISPAATAIMSALAARIAARRRRGARSSTTATRAPPSATRCRRCAATPMPTRSPSPARPTSPPMSISPRSPAPPPRPARRPRPLITQGEFLGRLGIAARAARLAAGKDDATRGAIAAAVAPAHRAGGDGRSLQGARALAFRPCAPRLRRRCLRSTGKGHRMLRSGTVAWSGETIKPKPLTHGLLEALPGIRHAFFTRVGGVSSGIYREPQLRRRLEGRQGLRLQEPGAGGPHPRRRSRPAGDALPGPRRRRGRRRQGLGDGAGPQGRRRGHQQARHRGRHRHRRLRADPLRRFDRPCRRRRPCRLARRARRHPRIDHPHHGGARRDAADGSSPSSGR